MTSFVEPRQVNSIEDCFFYHYVDIPEHGIVNGMSDMRPALPVLFDPVDFHDKDVVELGPAGGFLSFEMEKRGANVVSVELGADSDWDYIKHYDQPLADKRKKWREHLVALQNGYWFSHQKFKSNARVVHGTAYELDKIGIQGHIGVLSNVLVHMRDPLRAIESMARTVSYTLIICDCEPYSESRYMMPVRLISRKLPIAQFFAASGNKENDHTWWHLSPVIVREFVKILGFTNTKVVFFDSGLANGVIHQWGIIASRP